MIAAQEPRRPGACDRRAAAVPDRTRLWDAWNIDRMYAAGHPDQDARARGPESQKLVLLYGAAACRSSARRTGPARRTTSQEEHNCFCTDTTMFGWFTDDVRAQVEQHGRE